MSSLSVSSTAIQHSSADCARYMQLEPSYATPVLQKDFNAAMEAVFCFMDALVLDLENKKIDIKRPHLPEHARIYSYCLYAKFAKQRLEVAQVRARELFGEVGQ
jgi:hypothetical protein